MNQFINTLSAKRLELLREMLPGLTSIAFLLNPDSSQAEFESLDFQTAARAIGVRIEILTARNAHDIDALSPTFAQHATRHISRAICLGNSLPSAPLRSHNVLLTCDNRAAGVRRSYARTRGRWLRGRAMALEIHEPEVEMGGRQVIRVGNKDRPMSWITFHFESEADAMAAHEQLSGALSKAVKVEWP